MHQDRVQRNQENPVNPENLGNPGILGNLVTPENLAKPESLVNPGNLANPGNPESLVKDRYQREAKYQTIAKQTVKQHVIIAEPLLRKKQIDIRPL